jgi:2,3-bisphosphoglycerate-dependent phosphoglycerate mutase
VYFVRHAQPVHGWQDDRTRPLTAEGLDDARQVTLFFNGRPIDAFYCSPYKRSIQTIEGAAKACGRELILDERLRERESGPGGNNLEMFRRRWADLDFQEDGGESIRKVQTRNVAALNGILESHPDQAIAVGTHGTALSSILNHFDGAFDCDAFLRIIDWMPYIVELDFDSTAYMGRTERLFIQKAFRG